MESFSFPGTYADEDGHEVISWRIRSSDRPGWSGSYEIRTCIRGVEVWGADFDGLEPDRPGDLPLGMLPLNSFGDLARCVLTGDLPCSVEAGGDRRRTTVGFELDLREHRERPGHEPPTLRLSIVHDGARHTITDDWFEEGTLGLDAALRPDRLICCATCLYSDYSPGGHGLMGMRCHRDAEEQYLAARSKGDYWSVPVTEEVPETYLCGEYDHRVPGTGYRG